jgi:uncharacterized protein YbaR (Trm112 family)
MTVDSAKCPKCQERLAECNRLRGIIHAEMIADAHYCETCEMAFMVPDGAPRTCPTCALRREEELLARVEVFGIPHAADPRRPLRVERTRTGEDCWAVRYLGDCARIDGTWEFEPSPSSRDDAFVARTRFTLDVALALAKRIADSAHPP